MKLNAIDILSNITLYKEYNKNIYKEKMIQERNFKKHTLLTAQDKKYCFTLFDVNKQEKITRKAKLQNEIMSITKKIEDEKLLMCFTTCTIKPSYNLSKVMLNQNELYKISKDKNKFENHFINLDNQLYKQYRVFKDFSKKIKKHKTRERKSLSYDYLNVFELTKKLNLHTHQITLLKNKKDLYEYIKSVILSRKNTDIARTEIRLDKKLIDVIKNDTIIIRKKEYYITKYKKTKGQQIYKFRRADKEKGNILFLREIKDTINDKQHITKYLFKYLLKRSHKDSFENIVFKNIRMRQKQYSHKFFSKKIDKLKLFKISSIIYKNLKKNETLKSLNLNENRTIYEVSKRINNNTLKIQEDLKYKIDDNLDEHTKEILKTETNENIYIKINDNWVLVSRIEKFEKDTYSKRNEYKLLQEKEKINNKLYFESLDNKVYSNNTYIIDNWRERYINQELDNYCKLKSINYYMIDDKLKNMKIKEFQDFYYSNYKTILKEKYNIELECAKTIRKEQEKEYKKQKREYEKKQKELEILIDDYYENNKKIELIEDF